MSHALKLADADDDEADDEVYNREVDEDEEDEPCTDIDLDVFANELEDSSTGQVEDTSKASKITKFSTLLPKDRETAMMSGTMNYAAYNTEETDVNGAAAACASNPPDTSDVVIDESLFEELDEDLDDLDLDDGDD